MGGLWVEGMSGERGTMGRGDDGKRVRAEVIEGIFVRGGG